MQHRADDAGPIKVTRDIPLPWLVTVVGGIVVQAVLTWQGQQDQAKLIQNLTAEVREMRASLNQGGLKAVEHEMKLADHERRLQAQEARKP